MDKWEIIGKVALIFHEKWRKNRLYKPMLEKSKDDEWTKLHWTDVVDIANTNFDDLPANWKYENLEAAKVTVWLVYEKIVNSNNITTKEFEEMAKIVHEKRLERNWKEWSFENQRVEYEELSDEEKDKDRIQVQIAIQTVKECI